MNPIPIWNTPIPSQICANPRLSVLNQGFWGCIKRREFKQMHPSHGQVRANIVQLNMAHIKLEPMISGFISPEHHPRNRNWLQPPWSSQVPFVKDVGISSDILLQNLQTNSTVSFRKAQPNRWVFFNSCTNEAPEPSPSWIACSWIDHIWDDPLNNYHPAQTLGNPQRIYDIYGGFSGISDGWLSIIWAEFFFWVERLNHWFFCWGNRVSPGALLARLATWALAMLGGKGRHRRRQELDMFPMISWWAAPMVWEKKGIVNVCECCDLWPIWPWPILMWSEEVF